MAEDFAEAFRRYWAIIVTVGAAMVLAGGVYVSLLQEIAQLRSDLRDYGTERVGLLRDLENRDEDHAKRIDGLEARIRSLETAR